MTSRDRPISLLEPVSWGQEYVAPGPFLDERYQRMVDVLDRSFPCTKFAMIGFWPTMREEPLNEEVVRQMAEGKQSLDIDLFLPVTPTTPEEWRSIQEGGYFFPEVPPDDDVRRRIIPVGGRQDIIFYSGGVFLSPSLSKLDDSVLEVEVSKALSNHLPPEDVFQKTGRTGQMLTIIGEGVRNWGDSRRTQDEWSARPYLEIMPFIESRDNSEFLLDRLEQVGYSRDLAATYCRVRNLNGKNDLILSELEYRKYGIDGMPDLNMKYIEQSPINALNWIRREVKAVALYVQLDDHSQTNWALENFQKQYATFCEHVAAILSSSKVGAECLLQTDLLKKINDSYSKVAEAANTRFGLSIPDVIFPVSVELSQPQHTQSN